jgi:thiol-disulfide isomerase/thioredoxin
VAPAPFWFLGVALSSFASAHALVKRKYDDVDVTATWCPTCKAQHRVLDSLAKRPESAEIVVFEVDFDTQKDALKAFNARQQSP